MARPEPIWTADYTSQANSGSDQFRPHFFELAQPALQSLWVSRVSSFWYLYCKTTLSWPNLLQNF